MNNNRVVADSLATTKSNAKGNRNSHQRRAKHSQGVKSKSGSPSRRDSMTSAHLDASGRSNDPNWYFSSPELANQAAQLSFQNFIGSGTIIGRVEIPTIMKIRVNPCPGVTYNVTEVAPGTAPASSSYLPQSKQNDNLSGINLAATRIYNMLAKGSGRSQNYQPQDVSMLILATGSLAELSEHVRRIFGVLMITNDRNRMLPTRLVETMLGSHENAVEFMSNIANYRMQFNVAMARINQIPLLDNIGFIRKCRDIFQHLYVDSPSSMAQIFYYAPESVWILDEESQETGTCLKTKWLQHPHNLENYESMQQLLDLMNDMITALLNSSTLNLVYSDLLNMASSSNVPLWQFDYLAENYTVMPEYNRNALLQMHNMDIIGRPIVFNELDEITEDGYIFTNANDVYGNVDKNIAIYNPVFLAGTAEGIPSKYNETVVDMDTMDPTLEDRIESLRFCSRPLGWIKYLTQAQTYLSGPVQANAFVCLADHYITNLIVYRNDPTATGDYQKPITIRRSVNASSLPADYNQALSAFDWAPFMYVTGASGGVSDISYMIGDINYCTSVPGSYLARLMRIINTGLFEFRI